MAIDLGPLKKIVAPSADPVVAAASLSEEAQALVKPAMPVKALLDAELWTDALRVFAYALPKREAVWWACQCARQAVPDKPVPIDAEIVKAAETWVYRPNEQGRRAAMDLAMKTEFDRAAPWTGAAVFWSGGSIAPPEAPPVEPGETLIGNAVVGAVLLAVVQPDPAQADRKRQLFLAQAADIANGGDGRKVAAG